MFLVLNLVMNLVMNLLNEKNELTELTYYNPMKKPKRISSWIIQRESL